jgi:hypothetical protein
LAAPNVGPQVKCQIDDFFEKKGWRLMGKLQATTKMFIFIKDGIGKWEGTITKWEAVPQTEKTPGWKEGTEESGEGQ